MAATPSFAVTPKIGTAVINTANAARDGTLTISSAILTGTTAGTRVNRIEVQATGTTTAGFIRLFLHNGASSFFLFHEIPVTAITPSATVAAFSGSISEAYNPDMLPITLPLNWSIRASTEKTETFNVIVYGADL